MKAIYARQSLDKKDSLSIEGQIDECKTFLSVNEEHKIYQDKGFSGKNTERPGLKELMNDIKSGKIDTVIVYKVDRFSRNIIDFFDMYKVLEKHNCRFVSKSETFDTSTSMGEAMLTILIAFAQMERKNIQQRVKDNYYYRTATKGSWAGGPAPFGFKNGRNEDNISTLIVDEKEMEIVKLIYRLYYEEINMSLGKVGKFLSENGYKSRRKNGSWDSSSISKILQSTVYVQADNKLYKFLKLKGIKFLNEESEWTGATSCHIVGKRPGNANIRAYADLKEQSVYLTNFKPVIESSTYINVMNRLATNEQITSSNKVGVLQELGGKLKCSCGYAIKSYSKSTTGRPYLDCYSNRSLHICNHKFKDFNFYDIQEIVGAEIQKQLDDIKKTLLKKRDIRLKKYREIDMLNKRLSTILELSSTSELLAQATIGEIEKIQKRINALELELQMNHDIADDLQIEHFTGENHLKMDKIIYADLSIDEKKYIVNQFIDKIILDEDTKEINIIWKI